MRTNNVVELAQLLKSEEEKSRDFIAPKSKLMMQVDPSIEKQEPRLIISENTVMPLNQWAHGQLAEKLGIPVKYYERMREEEPTLLAKNVNTWLSKQNGTKFLVRTNGTNVRAILSDKYKPIPNEAVVFETLNTISSIQESTFAVRECALTDTAMYLKITSDTVHLMNPKAPDGDPMYPGIMVRNSEVGASKFQVDVYTWRQVCSNGAVISKGLSRVHLGRKIGGEGEIDFSQMTNELDIKTTLSAMGDIVRQVFIPERMTELMERIKLGQEVKVDEPVVAVEGLCKHYKLPDVTKNDILARFGQKTQYGLANAVTETARDTENEDQQIKLEEIGGEVMVLDENMFKKVTAWKEQ